jgi:hypothetical protein
MSKPKTLGRKGALFLILYILYFVIFVVSNLVFDHYYQSIYSYPEAVKGVVDCSQVDFRDNVRPAIKGQARFYHNRWAGQENDDSNPDAYLDFPGYWYLQGYDLNSYGSYGLTFTGLKPKQALTFFCYDQLTAFDIYVKEGDSDYTLLTKSGQLSKTALTLSENQDYHYPSYSMKGSSLDVIIEFGYRGCQGANKYIWIGGDAGPLSGTYTVFIAGIGLGGVLALFGIALTFFFTGPDRKERWPFLMLSLSFLGVYFASGDFPWVPLFGNWFAPAALINGIGMILVIPLVFYAFTPFFFGGHYFRLTKKNLPWILGGWLINILIFIFVPGPFNTLGILGPIILGAYFILRGYRHREPGQPLLGLSIMMGFFLTLLGIIGLDYGGVVAWGCYDFPSILLTIIGIVLDVVYFSDLKRTDAAAIISEQDEARYLEAKQEAMVRQVQPHFLFNSLTLLQNQYHKSMREGDGALTLVSESLASSIAASQKPLVPFEDELATLRAYAALMNLRNDTKIPLVIDSTFSGFQVPPLSLQTFIENAFKYAKLTEVPNGQITLTCHRDLSRVLIKISDNGVGFDLKTVDVKVHTGIENAKFRLSSTLGAPVNIESEVNRGTDVIISVPLGLYGK